MCQIDTNFVSFNDNFKDGYCVRKNYYGWETFVRERGKEYDGIGFPSESNALESLLKEILSIYVNDKNLMRHNQK